jgi:putative Ca2+/H+ antiporter (TMEM165/GDT1 family)
MSQDGDAMHPSVVVGVFPVIFVGELPDKTMFASLVLASRGRPLTVWLGAAAAFAVHVSIAVTIGVALFHVLPHRAVDLVVAALFGVGAGYAFWEARGHEDEAALVEREAGSHRQVVTTAFIVIFIAEWGDLTQILTANLAAHYHSGLSVATGAVLALWAVAALAVTTGTGLLRYVDVRLVRMATGVVLLALALFSATTAIAG